MFTAGPVGAIPRETIVATSRPTAKTILTVHKHPGGRKCPPGQRPAGHTMAALGLGGWAADSSGWRAAVSKPTKARCDLAPAQDHSDFFVPYF